MWQGTEGGKEAGSESCQQLLVSELGSGSFRSSLKTAAALGKTQSPRTQLSHTWIPYLEKL